MDSKYIPFNTYQEAELHLDACVLLINQMKANISKLKDCKVSNHQQIEGTVIKSIDVLIEGLQNLNLSIKHKVII